MSVRRLLPDGALVGACDYCGSTRIMDLADGEPSRYFCDECWAAGDAELPKAADDVRRRQRADFLAAKDHLATVERDIAVGALNSVLPSDNLRRRYAEAVRSLDRATETYFGSRVDHGRGEP